jgi:hypothetical protein
MQCAVGFFYFFQFMADIGEWLEVSKGVEDGRREPAL